MGIMDRLARRLFGGVIEAEVKRRLRAAAVTDDEESGWRKLTGDSTRNLDALKQERMIEIAYWLWENNPMGRWLIEITKDFILAEGLPYEAANEEVKAVLDSFWFDPVNRMDLYIEKYVRELFLYGELCLPAFTAEQTGMLRLGYVDPLDIKEVETDPHNVKVVIGVILKDTVGRPGRRYRTILPEGADDILSPEARRKRESYKDGECFFWAINNVTNSPRGRSELLTVADWLDAYEQFLFDYADKWPLLNTFVWDLEVEGGNEKTITEQVKRFTKKSGSVYGHNEKVKLTPSTPDLKAVDAETGARLFRNHILGPFGYPEHWYGGGGDVNRATAAEMGAPAFKGLSSKQRYVKYILESIFGVVIERARSARYLNVSDDDAGAYSVITPELASRDLTKYSTVIRDVTGALMQAEMQGWVDKETAQKIFASMMGYLGVEVDYEEVREKVARDEDEDAWKDYLDKRKKGGGDKNKNAA